MSKLLIVIALLLSGCGSAAGRYVVWPMNDQPPDIVASDKEACDRFADENRNNANALVMGGLGGGVGALGGAGVGAIAGSMFGRAGYGAGYGAALGAAYGLLGGLWQGAWADHTRYQNIYVECMRGKGYRLAG